MFNNTKAFYNLNFLKSIAILSVICAHIYVSDRKSINGLIAIFGYVGVPLFLFIAGLRFERQVKEIFLKYLLRLFIPWIFMGTFVYILSSQFGHTKSDINFISWFLFIAGVGTYLWFMPILFFCKIYFQLFSSSIKSCIIIVFISIISLLFTINHKLIIFNPYLNILNWIGWYSLGIIVSKYSIKFNKIYYRFLLFLILIILIISFDDITSYFSLYSIFFEIVTIFLFLYISFYNFSQNFFPARIFNLSNVHFL